MEPFKFDFELIKKKEIFLKNYNLHDIASSIGDKMLTSMGFELEEFGKDERYRAVWEAGKDKPDRIVLKDGRTLFLLDWKGKASEKFIMNQRAYLSYLKYSEKMDLPCWVIFFIIDREKELIEDIKCVELNNAKITKEYREWNGNKVVEFSSDSLVSLEDFLRKQR